MKTLYTVLFLLFISSNSYSQNSLKRDSIHVDTVKFKKLPYRTLQKVNIHKSGVIPIGNSMNSFKIVPRPLYRPTRLGSSSPLYDTYRKNDNGAGAVTTNPHKSGRTVIHESPTHYSDSLDRKADSIYLKND